MPSSPSTLTTLLSNYSPLHTPFLLHALIELPASLQFLLLPSRQLGRPTPHGHALIRQYALLLLSSVLIALAFGLSSPFLPAKASDADADAARDAAAAAQGTLALMALRGSVAAALALYHVGPTLRSVGRLWGRWQRGVGVLGLVACEPAVYLVVHVCVGWELGRCAWFCHWGMG